ncbi:MAG: serine hydrolase, partial [Gemmatimonadota bacterium]
CDDRAVVPHRAKGYDRAAGGFVNTEPISMTVPYAAGSICSTVLDLLAWRQALGTGRLFSKPLYERMIKPAVLSNGWRTNYGYGLARYRLGPVEVIRHGGTINGFQANLMYVPAADLIIAALANTSGADPVGVADRLAARLVGAAVAPRIAPAPVPVAELTDYIGRYEMAPYSIEVTAPAGQLQMAPAGFPVPARLNRQAADQFLAGPLYALGFYGSAAPLRFVREGGKVSGFELDNPLGGVIRARRVAP